MDYKNSELLTASSSTYTEPKSHREKMLLALHDSDKWHDQQAYDRINRKKKLMHRRYQEAIWWAIENLEAE